MLPDSTRHATNVGQGIAAKESLDGNGRYYSYARCLLGALKCVIWQAWNWALLKCYCGKGGNIKQNERRHTDERSFFGDYLFPLLPIRKHNPRNEKNLNNNQYQFLTEYISTFFGYNSKKNKQIKKWPVSKDNDKIQK